ncbi:eCIS core domain-containing protein [Sphingopyxis panaciterrae]
MRALDRQAMLQRPSPVAGARATMAVLAQAKSSLGSGPAVLSAPAISDAGRPLDGATRGSMESGFGRDFSNIRIHDDARAHDNARSLSARAYAAGDHIVFGEGQYRPESSSGQALIAHELAHSVQQGGIQMKADGPMPAAADAELEAQADRAAAAVTAGRAAPALSSIGAPAIFRAKTDDPAPAGSAASSQGGPTPGLPGNWTIIEPKPVDPGTDRLVVAVSGFELPQVKGRGAWVQEVYDLHKPDRLIFSPIFKGKGATVDSYDNVAAYKEGSEKYKTIWLNKYGFTSLKSLGAAFKTAAASNADLKAKIETKEVATILKGFAKERLTDAKCDIDHIVEKQLQGTSSPANLQLLGSAKNQASGRDTYQELVGLVNQLKGTEYGHVRELQFRFTTGISVKADTDTKDGSQIVEEVLRNKVVTGSDEVSANAEGDPVTMTAGGAPETMKVRKSGATPIDFNFKRIVPGMRLTGYSRTKKKGSPDDIEGVLDGKLVKTTGKADEFVQLDATLQKEAEATPSAPADGADDPKPPSERRVLKLRKSKQNDKIAFHYPYLSPGWIKPQLDDAGNIHGTGVIKSTIPMLGEVGIEFGPDLLKATAPISAAKLKSPIPGLRFTGGAFELQLSPTFVPSGSVQFEIGPRGKPIILGSITAQYAGGAFEAEGKIKPGVGIPGVQEAEGNVRFHSEKGWSGELKINSTSVPNTVIDVRLMMAQKGDKLDIEAEGNAKITVRNKTFDLNAKWAEGSITYRGTGRWEKPFKIVDAIEAKVYYRDGYLKVTGGGFFTFRDQWKGDITLTYERYPGGSVKVEGIANVNVETKNKKGKGKLSGGIDEHGKLYGKGTIAYQITPTICPELTVELDKEDHLHITGSLTLGPYTLFDKYPKEGKGRHDLFKITTPGFSIPTPIPAVRAYVKFFAGVGYTVFFGPGVVETIKISGSFDPLEENPNIVADLGARFTCVAGFGLYGNFGATLGVDVLFGAGDVHGTITVSPGILGTAKADVEAKGHYEKGSFTVGMHPKFEMSLDATLGIGGSVTISALWGLLSYTWDFDIASFSTNLAKKVVDVGEFSTTFGGGGGAGGEMPGATEKAKLPDVDPMGVIKDIMRRREEKSAPNPNYDPNARPPGRDYIGNKI